MVRFGFVFTSAAILLFCANVQAQNKCKQNRTGNQSSPKSANRIVSSQAIFASMIADGEGRGGAQQGRRPQGPQGNQDRRRPQFGDGQNQDLRQRNQQEGQRQEGQRGDQRPENIHPVQRIQMMFKQMDQNGDGKISKREAPERLRERFDKADTNSDGLLDRQEQIAVMKKILEMMKNQGKENARGGEGNREAIGPDENAKRRPRGEEGPAANKEFGEFGEFDKPREKPARKRPAAEKELKKNGEKNGEKADAKGGVFGEF